ncbi:glyoxylase-like metal-dependent hydrolase (beta-lactamase superfamily II)/rhodanese-related sulfurtransferase [Hymenobacter luteus]|uniref:MBL fold metallo-hydrolase n=3 Tax=Hymenobacter TaxID=89966 RepID=A0A428J0C5_9BACT|nr:MULTISPECIES: rhodanese-like domain-containing protein [Hymenobacter]MBB4603656.1 glyoxylase-like metal-dependent hydrolase (beta-lactamase superfamily II)/rhodanese-related sulfurtransferase [Hymenobacter latericoloratus]MBB6061403.1 glyoxylase-like metal-dependent hydrolase (beta-lactamase superfamily II)/rhodanese-related sulfurtransferase [Hymenobacter luteus]RSK25020.1 MBL fold metallo-hydrolase [Hymenobacter metallilatus]
MKIEQFEDKGLAHFSYAILSECAREIVLVDPARDPQPYYDFARQHDAQIVAVLETHPHADFVSSHREVAQHTGAVIRVSKLLGAEYAHEAFDDGDSFTVGKLTFRALNTPGHSPDSVSTVLIREGRDVAVFTGDTLLIGDVGRPDLREKAGNLTAKREELAKQLYHSTREKLMTLADDVLVYPAHGAGSLCSKATSTASSSTIGAEKNGNYALRPQSEEAFVQELLADQPFIPKYFGYDVDLNKAGAPDFAPGVARVPRLAVGEALAAGVVIVDTRPEAEFKRGHLPQAINIQQGGKFETWLGSLVGPTERFYLLAADGAVLDDVIRKTAKIGYEPLILGARVGSPGHEETMPALDVEAFRAHPDRYTVVDIRNPSEHAHEPLFAGSLSIPLPELRERAGEIPTGKPVVVHCAGGYRSAAGSSIVAPALPGTSVFDLGEAVKSFPVLAGAVHA